MTARGESEAQAKTKLAAAMGVTSNRLLKNSVRQNGFPLGRVCDGFTLPRSIGWSGVRRFQTASSRGSFARLQATIVRVKRARTRWVPRSTVWAMPPMVLAQPIGSLIFFRRFCDTA